VIDASVAMAAIRVALARDLHLSDCRAARDGGPDTTLACAECGRAMWMHGTRHDTCPRFEWVTERSITDAQIQELRMIPGISNELKLACSKALNEFGGHYPRLVRESRAACATAINEARRVGRDGGGA